MNTNDIRINLPASKSMSNRWLILNYLSGGCFRIGKLSTSGDTRLLRNLLAQLSEGKSDLFYCENAGSVARFLMPILCITGGSHTLTGDERLRQRPMAPLIDALRQLGFRIECTDQEGFLPVQIQGSSATRRTVLVDPLLSSQYVSSLLLVAPFLDEGLSLTMTGRPTSRPYIEMTVDALRQAGVDIRRSSNGRTYYVQPLRGGMNHRSITIERDWSSASYFYTMALLKPSLRIRLLGLQLDTCQGDSATDAFFRQLGVVSNEVRSPYRSSSRSITIQGGGTRQRQIQFVCLDCPDLVPTFAVAAAAAGVKTLLKGVGNISLKESNRMESITAELNRMGVGTVATRDTLTILPSELKPTGPVRTYGDHRIAMAFAPLRMLFPDLEIEDPRVVDKSFPEFWDEFEKLETGNW